MALSSSFVPEYPESYSEARRKFLQSVWALKKREILFEAFELKIQSEEDPELFVDAVYFPAKRASYSSQAKQLFVLSSGVHGVEAPIGSAIQIKFLNEILPQLDRDDLGVLLIHSLNPYGFLKSLRVTEKNVDLNRNFFLSSFGHPKENLSYKKYQETLSPKKHIKHYWKAILATAFHMILPVLGGREAKRELTQGFAGGQYADEKGIYFGGKTAEPQVEWVRGIMTPLLNSYKELVHFDVHTGLGKASCLQLIASQKTKLGSPELEGVESKFKSQEDIFFVSADSDAYYKTSGDFIDYVYDLALSIDSRMKVMAFTAEFGTLGDTLFNQLSTSLRIILENQNRHWGSGNSYVEKDIKRNFNELFNPSSLKWRQHSLDLGFCAIEKVLLEFKREFVDKKTGT